MKFASRYANVEFQIRVKDVCSLRTMQCRRGVMPQSAIEQAPLIDCAYVHDRNAIQIIANLDAGWTRKLKTYGYSQQLNLDFTGDYFIRISTTVLPRPSGFVEDVYVFPAEIQSSGGNMNPHYTVTRSVLTILVQLWHADHTLNMELPWIVTRSGKPAIRWVEDPIARRARTHFELQLLMVFNAPPSAKPEDVRDWQRHFCPGGLPGLGKRR